MLEWQQMKTISQERLLQIVQLLSDLDELVFRIMSDEGIKISKIKAYQSITFFQITKLHTSFGSVITLVKEQLGFDSLILARSMLNNLINAIWLNLKYKERRANRFLYYTHKLRYLYLKKLKKHHLNSSLFSQVLDQEKEITRNYNSVKNKFKGREDWSGIPISRRAEETHLDWDYDIVYSIASSYEHSDVISSQYFIDNSEESKNLLEFKSGPSPHYVEESSMLAFKYMLSGIETIKEVFNLGEKYDEEMKKLVDRFTLLFKRLD